MPALSFGVSQIGWGQIVRSEQPAVETVVETSEPTFEKTVVNNHQARMPTEPTWTAGAVMLAADALSNYTNAAHLFREEVAVQASRDTLII